LISHTFPKYNRLKKQTNSSSNRLSQNNIFVLHKLTYMFKKSLLLLTLSLAFNYCIGQTAIYGSWTAHCALEQTSSASVRFCGLCPMETSDSAVEISEFNISIDSAHITFESTKERIRYIRRPSGNAITFVKGKEAFYFEILVTTSTNHVILKSKDGLMLLLEKRVVKK
jgi:hypothetical protein